MAVTIESLDYQNGFTYRECHVPLMHQGLVYLNGLNGAGKSTPFEVLQHILFGTTSRGVKKDGIICAVPDSDGFLGELVLRNPDGRWLIRQARNHSQHKTITKVYREVDGKWSTRWEGGGCPKKMDDAQKLAGSLLGLQAHEFSGCMYLSQTSAHTLIEGTPADKMRYIAQLFGIDVCDRVVTMLKGELKDAVSLTVEVPVLQAQLAEREAEAQQYDVPRAEDLLVMQSALDAAAEQKQSLRDVIYDARDAIASAGQRDELLRKRAQIGNVGTAEALRARAARLARKRDSLRDSLRVNESHARLQTELARFRVTESVEQLTGKCSAVQAELTDARAAAAQLQKRADLERQRDALGAVQQVTSVRQQLERHRRERAESDVSRTARVQELMSLQGALAECEGGTCPTCRQPLDVQQLDRLIQQTAGEVEQLEARCLAAVAQERESSMRLEKAERFDSLTAQLGELPVGDADELAERVLKLADTAGWLDRQRTEALKRDTLRRQLDGLPERCDDVEPRLARTETLLAAVQGEVERAGRAELLDQQLATVVAVDVAASERTVGLAEEVLEALESAAESLRERHVRAQVASDDYRDLLGSVVELRERLDALAGPRERVKVLEASIAAMQKLKRRKLHQVVEAIRDCLPRFASTMFSHEPSTRFVVASDDESLDLLCRRRVNGRAVDIAVKSLSGGEKQRLSVALVFTLHALLHARKRPDLLILDEVDRGLDDVGIASLMSLVRGVRERYGTVIMTSHRSQIAGAAFDRTWTVTKADEVSRLQLDGGRECSA